jgi:hypothetical protein
MCVDKRNKGHFKNAFLKTTYINLPRPICRRFKPEIRLLNAILPEAGMKPRGIFTDFRPAAFRTAENYPTEKAGAMEHLDFAIKEFREMKMQPSLERALNLHSEWSHK